MSDIPRAVRRGMRNVPVSVGLTDRTPDGKRAPHMLVFIAFGRKSESIICDADGAQALADTIGRYAQLAGMSDEERDAMAAAEQEAAAERLKNPSSTTQVLVPKEDTT